MAILTLVLFPTVDSAARSRTLPLMTGLIVLFLIPAFLYWRFGIEVPSWVYLLGSVAAFAVLWTRRRRNRL